MVDSSTSISWELVYKISCSWVDDFQDAIKKWQRHTVLNTTVTYRVNSQENQNELTWLMLYLYNMVVVLKEKGQDDIPCATQCPESIPPIQRKSRSTKGCVVHFKNNRRKETVF
jgi:hypothetical protein